MRRRDFVTDDQSVPSAAAESVVESWRMRIARQRALVEDLAARGEDVRAERALLSTLLDCAADALS
jgi:hypothetical protein